MIAVGLKVLGSNNRIGKIRKVLYCPEEEKRIVLLIGIEQNAIVIHMYIYVCFFIATRLPEN